MSIVYLTVGPPGTGKSVWARQNAPRLDAAILSADAVRNEMAARGENPADADAVYAIVEPRLDTLLGERQNVIVDTTHYQHCWRSNHLTIARRHGARAIAVWFDFPPATSWQVNAMRPPDAPYGERPVREATLTEILDHFQPPLPGEFDEVWKVTDWRHYQSIWLRGGLVRPGERECAGRYALIRDYLDQLPRRPSHLLDLGANMGYFSIRLAADFDCRVIAVEGPYGDVLQNLLRHNGDSRIALWRRHVTADDLAVLARNIRFDAVLALSIVHHLQADLSVTLPRLRALADHLIVELPWEPNACGQAIVRQAAVCPLPPGARLLGHSASHLVEGGQRAVYAITNHGG